MRRRTVCDELKLRGFRTEACENEADAIRLLSDDGEYLGLFLIAFDATENVVCFIEELQHTVSTAIAGVYADSELLLPAEQLPNVRFFCLDSPDVFDDLAASVGDAIRTATAGS